MPGLRKTLFEQLDSSTWPKEGLSPVNRLMATIIALAILLVVLETEPTIYDSNKQMFSAVDLILGAIFTIEYLLRVWTAGEIFEYQGIKGRFRYIFTPLALVDFLAIVPFFIGFIGNDLFILRLARLLRIVSLAKFGRYSVAVRNFISVLQRRRYELTVSLLAVLVVLLLAASIMYAVEGPAQPEEFGSIPRALWWAVITLTTVGYGDACPKTILGRLCCGVTAIVSIGLLAMPTAILAAAFSETFTRQDKNDEDQANLRATVKMQEYPGTEA
jgi:voltage-gated potassium channel